MGNCCTSESSTVWATLDEWDWESDEDSAPRNNPVTENEHGVGDDIKSMETSTTSTEQMKVSVTKEELAELLSSARLQGMPVDRVFSRLIAAVDLSHVERQHSWAPTLHTIAE